MAADFLLLVNKIISCIIPPTKQEQQEQQVKSDEQFGVTG
jgi:hypothetical protein